IDGARVELLSAGTAPPPAPPSPTSPAVTAAPAPAEHTPVATAVLPHSVGEFVGQSETKQNLTIVAALVVRVSIIVMALGLFLGLRLLVVSPIAVLLTTAGIYLWLHTRKLKRRLEEKSPPASSARNQ